MLNLENIEYLRNNGIVLWDKETRDSYLHNDLYKKTNKYWCQYKYNSRNVIGHMMELLKECNPANFEEWQDFYLKSGEIAFNLKKNINEPNPKIYAYEMRKINQSHGKSVHDLVHTAIRFKNDLAANGIYINNETAFNFTIMRAIDQPFVRL